MAINPVQAAEALTRAARTEFANTYRQRYSGVLANLSSVMHLAVPSDKFQEVYVYPESAPHPRRVPAGDGLHTEAFRYRSYTITNLDWATGVEWYRNHALFDQTGTVVSQARSAGGNFALLPERVFFQLVRGAADTDLLASATPTAPDGAVLYATTDGAGAARFGATNGNLLTGNGVASAATLRSDFFNAVEQFTLFQDTKSQPLLPADILDMGFTIFFGAANTQVFREAFVQGVTAYTQTNVAGAENVGAAGVSNIILDSGLRVKLVPTQRITDNDWFVFADGVDIKPIVEQVASPLEEMPFNVGNSDKAREYQVEGIYWKAVRGYGLNLPYGTIKVNN